MFVRFDEPIQLRRELLVSSKDVVEMLQKFEQFKLSRIKKFELMVKYKNLMSEVDVLCSKLKKTLPKVDKSIVKKVEVKPDKSEPISVPEEKNRLRDLDVELQDIEAKLKSLS